MSQMDTGTATSTVAASASIVVVDPNGNRKRVPVEPLPFLIGRQPDNHLILRDSRVSRAHTRIVVENGAYVLEDIGSRARGQRRAEVRDHRLRRGLHRGIVQHAGRSVRRDERTHRRRD